MGEKRYNFTAERMSDKELEFYDSLDIKNAYWGGDLMTTRNWVVDKEKQIYYKLNSTPGRLQLEGINGPNYSNLIYKGIVNVVAFESYIDVKKRTVEYRIKEVILDRRLENEKEDFIEAVMEAISVYDKRTNYTSIFKEIPETVKYKEFNLAHWRYRNFK